MIDAPFSIIIFPFNIAASLARALLLFARSLEVLRCRCSWPAAFLFLSVDEREHFCVIDIPRTSLMELQRTVPTFSIDCNEIFAPGRDDDQRNLCGWTTKRSLINVCSFNRRIQLFRVLRGITILI